MQVIFLVVAVLKVLGGTAFGALHSVSPGQWAKVVLNLSCKFWLFSCECGPKGSLITYQVEAPQGGSEAGTFEKWFREQGY